ncbi:MAG: hypothetical protein PHD81_04965 [Candidatus Nanoarchaeia archaeon]|nr:hypothetical protein [Candidatus Nanoarchaeia archaeon]MDD5588429.1 hypothetical protein [Candidatus Nanoarchaeia archaeon]
MKKELLIFGLVFLILSSIFIFAEEIDTELPSPILNIPDEKLIVFRTYEFSCSVIDNIGMKTVSLISTIDGIEICSGTDTCTGEYIPTVAGANTLTCTAEDTSGNINSVSEDITIYIRSSTSASGGGSGSGSSVTTNSYSPYELNVNINGGSSQLFAINASIENLTYNWELYKNNGQVSVLSNIIFTRDNKEIFSINPDGSNLTQLTFKPSDSSYNERGAIYDEDPVLTKDGKIVFRRKEGEFAWSGAYQLWLMNGDGTGQKNLTSWFTVSMPPSADYTGKLVKAISLSDSNIYYNIGDRIWKIDYNGTNEELVFPLNITGNYTSGCMQISVSPDGTKIVCIKGSSIELMNIDGTNEIILATNNYTSEYPWLNPTPYTNVGWNFDGTRITFVRDMFKLWSMNLDGSDLQLVVDRSCASGVAETLCNSNYFYKQLTKSCWLSNNEIIYSGDGEVYKKDLSTGNITQFTFRDPEFIYATPWDQKVNCRPILKTDLQLMQQSNEENFTFLPTNEIAGDYILNLTISNGITNKTMQWNIKVNPYVAPTPSSSSGGGGGGGRSSCSSKWICNGWEECINGKQKCLDWYDENGCKNFKSKPINKTQECIEEKKEEIPENQTNQDNSGLNSITGGAVVNVNGDGLFSLIGNFFSNIWNWFKNLI